VVYMACKGEKVLARDHEKMRYVEGMVILKWALTSRMEGCGLQ